MKTCPRCKQTKSLSEWPSVKNRSDGVGSYCRSCTQQYRRDWDKVHAKGRRLVRKQRAQLAVREAKQRPCMDCGESYPYYVMDFDHREGEHKVQIVSILANRGTLKQVREEIAKCDVVCSNCHRIRTFKRLGVA